MQKEKRTPPKKKEWLGSKREINNERLWPFLLSILLINLTQREREREREIERETNFKEWVNGYKIISFNFLY